jgi:microcystin-dependent protein
LLLCGILSDVKVEKKRGVSMSQPYVGQMMMFAGTFAPAGWALCQGQLVPISENDTLFQLIGTTYGGDGQETFGLPNMAGRIPIHQGTGPGLSPYVIGESGGTESVTLTTQQIPQHNHLVVTNNNQGSASTPNPSTIMSAQNIGNGSNTPNAFAPYASATQVTLPATTIQNTGGSQPHNNIQPVLCMSWIIALYGVYPSPT